MPCTVVVGAQWGDEGKGKIVDALSAEADAVARYQGGPNAGHSVIHEGRTVVLHLIPSGILHPGRRCLIGNGVVVDLAKLREEASHLESLGIDVRGRRVLLEGAQGTMLDLDHGTYPFVTSSPASAAGAPLGVGLGPRVVDRVIGVAKAYATRVGNGPFPTEMPEAEAARLREAGEEYGATTGRPRRCGWLDLPALKYAARINGLDQLVITKLDVLDGFDEIRVAEGYDTDARPVTGFPTSARALEACRPRWRSFAGWRTSSSEIRRWDDLPSAARDYLEWIEEKTGVPITTVSVGAGRDAEIRREASVR